jgi:hypothetical protein
VTPLTNTASLWLLPLEKWKVAQLKAELRKRKGKLGGNKNELIKRLQDMEEEGY